METTAGLTIVSPQGAILRVPRNSPQYAQAKALLQGDSPMAQVWHALQKLLENPFQGLVSWFAHHGVSLAITEEAVTLDGINCSPSWLVAVKRYFQHRANPRALLLWATQCQGRGAVPSMYLVPSTGQAPQPISLVAVPAGAELGSLVLNGSLRDNAPLYALVRHPGVTRVDGALVLGSGVITHLGPREHLQACLKEPLLSDQEPLYRCQMGYKGGWLEDNSYATLEEAKANLKDILAFHAEGRILNRSTGEVVPV